MRSAGSGPAPGDPTGAARALVDRAASGARGPWPSPWRASWPAGPGCGTRRGDSTAPTADVLVARLTAGGPGAGRPGRGPGPGGAGSAHRLRWPAHPHRARCVTCASNTAGGSTRPLRGAIRSVYLLPGPASMQLSRRPWPDRRGGCRWPGVHRPGLAVILALAVVFLAASPPLWVLGAGAGAGAAVAAVAVHAGTSLVPASWARSPAHRRCATCGRGAVRRRWAARASRRCPGSSAPATTAARRLLLAAWIGADGTSCSSRVGCVKGRCVRRGFVIIPLLQHDAVLRYHCMTDGQFHAVALGRCRSCNVAVVGCRPPASRRRARGGGGVSAPFVASSGRAPPLRRPATEQSRTRLFLDGAGPAAIALIIAVAVPLALALSDGVAVRRPRRRCAVPAGLAAQCRADPARRRRRRHRRRRRAAGDRASSHGARSGRQWRRHGFALVGSRARMQQRLPTRIDAAEWPS